MTIGALLREQRECLNYSLADLAVYLHIRLPYLEAIENDLFDELPPGSAYRVGFIKSYASVLQLDADKAVELFRKEQSNSMKRQPLVVRRPISESHVPTFSLIFIILALFAAIWIGWSYLHRSDRTLADEIPAVPERLQAKPAQVEAAATTPPVAAGGASNGISTAAAGPSEPPPIQPPVPVDEPPSPPADVEPDEARDDPYANKQQAARAEPAQPAVTTPPPAGSALGSTAASHVEIQAIADSWVQIRDGSKVVYSGLMHAGDSYRVPDQAGWFLTAGNAGGITLAVDGKPGQPLGAPGVVAHNVALDAGKVMATVHP